MQKLYYSISDVCRIIDEEQHILRYWEKEFTQLKPKKNRGGNRVYSEKDLLMLKSIKYFLRNDKLSVKSAKEAIAKMDFSTIDQTPFVSKIDNFAINTQHNTVSENVAKPKTQEQKHMSKELAGGLHSLLSDMLVFLKQ
jgi:DNA-binding transcriptional MerR regulator